MNNQKIALITGANRGLGYETAKQLGEKKVTVIVGARQRSAAKEAVAALKEKGIDAYAIQLDITSASDRSAAFAFIEENFGRLDILINNAGVVPDDFMTHPLNVQVSNKELEYVFNTNFFSVVHLTKDMLPLLKRSSSARIVNVSSIMGSLTLQSMENSPFSAFRSLSYNASKTSLNLFTILLSEELKGTNIKVNSAHPGWVKTEMGTQAAPMEIEDGAKTSVALALMEEDGPTGKFIHAGESLPW